jgi:hypothetical protein
VYDLEETYAAVAVAHVEFHEQEEGMPPHVWRTVFDRSTLPVPPAGLSTARVIIAEHSAIHPNQTVDMLIFSAHRETYRALGLFILASLLSPGPNRFELALTHPASDVRRLVVDTEYRRLGELSKGLRSEALGAVYHPSVRPHLPGREWAVSPLEELPDFSLTDDEGFGGRNNPLGTTRHVVEGFRSDRGAYAIAELLLDVSQAWNEWDEYVLEGVYGFGGVAPGSAEVRFWLPGGDGWNPADWGPNAVD